MSRHIIYLRQLYTAHMDAESTTTKSRQSSLT
uniref:Uncharacterized protein n=1 Tax=Arundo donax TaxID=35708 RepID=A0A0A9FU50_ARUDO